jgi:hypothetical protein
LPLVKDWSDIVMVPWQFPAKAFQVSVSACLSVLRVLRVVVD